MARPIRRARKRSSCCNRSNKTRFPEGVFMKKSILAGALFVGAGAFGLMAQAPAQAPAQGAAPHQPTPKNQAEVTAIQALFAAQGNPDAIIKAADDLMTKFADT